MKYMDQWISKELKGIEGRIEWDMLIVKNVIFI